MDRRTFTTGAAASVAAVACSQITSPRRAGTPTRGVVTTNDGVTLRYEEAGSGKPLVCIPGWSQTAAQFKHQLSGLSDGYRVIAVDMRGHGESFEEFEGGNHFMFMENPDKFNRIVRDFMA
jgi:pimeloyl-ACP methyl ester carboxylesterase